jgi:formamidopyrimidine-DNA glycosylase
VPELPEVETARRLIADRALPRCGAEMVHGTVGGRSAWWCSREQAAWPDAA